MVASLDSASVRSPRSLGLIPWALACACAASAPSTPPPAPPAAKAAPPAAPPPPPAAPAPVAAPTPAPAPAPTPIAPTPPVEVEAPTAARVGPTKVLILGDSMAATDFGRALEEELAGVEQLKVSRRGKSATGLARPDFFDWPAEAERLMAKHAPTRVVIVLGGNDGQDLLGDGPRVRWGSETWAAAYADRWRAFVDKLLESDAQREIVLLALPVMDRPRLEKKLGVIRTVQAEVAAAHPRVRYFETRGWFFEGEAPRAEVELAGKRYPLRQDDGIHFSRPGAIWLARQVAPLLEKDFTSR